MLKNYFAIAFRNLAKHKVFSFINIFGLAVGIACCILLTLYIKDELSYEQHFEDHERIYRIYSVFTKEGNEESFPFTSPPVAPVLATEFPEVELTTRLINPPDVQQHLIRYKDHVFYEKLGYLVDSTFFDVFSFEFREGNRFTALDGPSSVVLSAQVADKIFGEQSPIDELLIINSGNSTDTFRITGVLQPIEKPSHVNGDFYMSINSRGWGQFINSVSTWAWQNFTVSYVKLRPNSTVQNVEEKIPALIELHSGTDLKNAGLQKDMYLQPIDDIQLYSDFENSYGVGEKGNLLYVYILTSIGVFILLLACINFMNLTTAKASQRAGEVGVRKTLGATRKLLIAQFLGESMTIVFLGMLLAIGIVQLVLPLFNEVSQKNLSINAENAGFIISALLSIGIVTGLLAGSYPAFFLSSFQPAKVLKDKRLSGGSSNFLRKALVVFQFVISIGLISSIVIIQNQLSYIQSKGLGFNHEFKLMIPLRTNEAKQNYMQVKNAFSQIAGVEQVSASGSLPSTPMFSDFFVYPQGSSAERAVIFRNTAVDENYFDLLEVNLLAGRDLIHEVDSFSWQSTERKILVNKAGLDAFNISMDDALGTKLLSEWEGRVFNHEIVGVLDDFHQFSLHQPIRPLLFFIPVNRTNFNYVVASVNKNAYKDVMAQMELSWKEHVQATPFEVDFLSDSVKRQYQDDQRVSTIIMAFTILAIIISCLGLYGLSVYVAERRVKEIGIRKIMGGSVFSIVTLLSKDFVKLILIALLIAAPLGYYAMSKWLQGFAYKIELSIGVFLITGVISLLIAWLTVGFESVKAAVANPVNSLRSE